MVQKILLSSLVVGALLFSGCGDSEGEERLELQQALDKGDYLKVVSALSGKTNLSNEEKMMLGAAYMGKAGMSFSDIASVVLEVGEESDDGDLFADFIAEVGEKSSSSALVDLTKASGYFEEVVGERCKTADDDDPLSNTEKDVCLYIGLTDSMKAASAINAIAGDVSFLSDDEVGTDNKLKASACAMQYALDGNDGSLDSDCTAIAGGQITFTQSSQTYDQLTINIDGDSEDYEYLVTTNRDPLPESTAMTNGYCTLDDFTTRADYNTSDVPVNYYICPVNESNDADEEITSTDVIVDALNNGTDAIGAAGNDEMQDDINEFKCEILGGTYNGNTCTGADLNDNVDEQAVIDYLNNNNN